jgi:hypothetical protein
LFAALSPACFVVAADEPDGGNVDGIMPQSSGLTGEFKESFTLSELPDTESAATSQE